MKRLHLSVRGVEVPINCLKFPGGELHPVIQQSEVTQTTAKKATITAGLRSSEDVIGLLLVTDAVKRLWSGIKISVCLPYIPYGRQDRVANPGEALAIKVFCDIINHQHYHEVATLDPHSEVTSALLHNLRVIPQERIIANSLMRYLMPSETVLVAPDAGAAKKTRKVADLCGFTTVFQASKSRDTLSGEITGTTVNDGYHIGSRNFLIVDDICDGGRTFVELAKELKQYTSGNIYLYVTHGIFSNGLQEMSKHIKHVYTANPFADAVSDDLITVLKNYY